MIRIRSKRSAGALSTRVSQAIGENHALQLAPLVMAQVAELPPFVAWVTAVQMLWVEPAARVVDHHGVGAAGE